MNTLLAATVRAVLGVLGLLAAVLLLNLSLFSIQGMSGQEPFGRMLTFLTLSFALAFGVGAGSVRALRGKPKPGPTVCAFAIGGGLGGALFALALRALDQFDSQLRTLTGGGPLGVFLLAATLGAVGSALLVGLLLARRFEKRVEFKRTVG